MATSLAESHRRAKARLEDMAINEVSLVDQAANLRKLVVTKRNDDMANATNKASLKLPSAAKQSMMDGIGQALDKLTALATMVGDAETDDAAAVPGELANALKQTGETLTGMAAQFAAAPPAEGAPPANAGAEGAPPPPDTAGKSNTEKALPTPQKDPPFKTEQHEGDSLKTLYHKTIAAAHNEVAEWGRLDKAGRKIKGERYKKLSDLHDNLGKLLNELAFDEAAEAAAADGAAKAKKPAEAEEKAPAKKGETAPEPSEAVTLLREMKGLMETQGKRILAVEESVAKGVVSSNAGHLDDAPPPPKNVVQWSNDMSEAVAKRRQAANGRK